MEVPLAVSTDLTEKLTHKSLPSCSIHQTKDKMQEEEQTISHTELKRIFQETLSCMLESDPLLCDLDPHVTLEEVRNCFGQTYHHHLTIFLLITLSSVFFVFILIKPESLFLRLSVASLVVKKILMSFSLQSEFMIIVLFLMINEITVHTCVNVLCLFFKIIFRGLIFIRIFLTLIESFCGVSTL